MTQSRSLAGLALAVATLAAFIAAPRPAPATVTYNTYFAGMHNHTGYSDGVPETTPADAYAKADLNGLDIMTVTEHSEGFDVPMTLSEQCLPTEGGTMVECALADGENSARKWDANLEQATTATTSDFLAARGFEWTSDVFDHINVYLSSQYTNAKTDGGYATMETFWGWFLANRDALATFNHPGDKEQPDSAKPWNDFAYVPGADHRMVGIEVFNGGKGKDYTDRTGAHINYIAKALDKGWHVGLIGAQDTHTDDWGDPTKYARTGFLMPALTELDFRDALLARRFYATSDANLELRFTGDGEPMGSRLRRPADTDVTLSVTTADPDAGDAVTKIELFTNGGAAVGTPVFASLATFTVPSDWGESWYLVRVTQADGEKAYSSPIWIGANTHPHGEWLAGDLHVHTENGHDTCMGDDPTKKYDGTDCPIDEIYTWSFSVDERIKLAKERGLDYLAITDHNNVLSQQTDAWKNEKELILVPAYENSLPGHGQMLGATHCFPGPVDADGVTCKRDSSIGGVQSTIVQLHAEDGAFQVNHPSDRDWLGRYDQDANGNGTIDLFELVPDSIEVWNIGPWVWQPPAPAANDNDYSLTFWERYLKAGHKVAATGGSDSHWRLTSAVQGVGQPTTWVFSGGSNWQDVTAGIRAGNTTVSYHPPAYKGARLFLEADADKNGTFESLAGETVPKGSWLRYRVENAPPGAVVRIVEWDPAFSGENEQIYPVNDVAGGAFGTPATWVRAELYVPDANQERSDACPAGVAGPLPHCVNRYAMLALTSPIYQA